MLDLNELLTEEEKCFLKELAYKRKTQEKDGCVDPVFWMISDRENVFDEDGEYYVIYSDDGDGELYSSFDKNDKEDLKGLKEYILEHCSIDEEMEEELKEIDDEDSLIIYLDRYDIELSLNIRHFSRYFKLSTMTGPFLTKDAAKKHIKENYYHYSKEVSTYGMVGWRNPEFVKLMKIVEKFDNIKM